jgi:hypothetical protein
VIILNRNHEEESVLKTVDAWIRAYECRDIEGFKKVLSRSETHVSWGTGKDECYVGLSGFLKCVERDFEQSEGARLKLISVYPIVHENWAWVAAEFEPTVIIKGIEHKLENLRGTFVLAKENGTWVIEHTHASWPYAEQAEGRSFPV